MTVVNERIGQDFPRNRASGELRILPVHVCIHMPHMCDNYEKLSQVVTKAESLRGLGTRKAGGDTAA